MGTRTYGAGLLEAAGTALQHEGASALTALSVAAFIGTFQTTQADAAPVRLRFAGERGQVLVPADAPLETRSNSPAGGLPDNGSNAANPARPASAPTGSPASANNGATNGNGAANGNAAGSASVNGDGQGDGEAIGNQNGAVAAEDAGSVSGNGKRNAQSDRSGAANSAGSATGAASQGGRSGNSNSAGRSNGAENGNGAGQELAQSGASGPTNGNGNGVANGLGNGQANGTGNDPENGNGNGAANPAGRGNPNGDGSGNGNDELGDEILPAQAVAAVPTESAVNQVQQLIEKQIEGKDGAKLNGALSGIHQYCINAGLSVFAISGVSRLRHDGVTVTTPGETFQGPAFAAWIYGFTAGVRWDGSSAFDFAPNTLLFGGFGHYASTDLDIGDRNHPGFGRGHIEGFSVGAYSLFNREPFYLLGVVSRGWSYAELSGPGGELSPQGTGYLVSASAGTLVAVAGDLKLDLRVGMDWSRAVVDDYRDSAGLTYRDGLAAELNGSASGKLFFQHQFGRNTVRPFAQAGIAQRLDGINAVEIEGNKYTFDDADLGVFGRLGVDIDADGLQSYLAVRGEKSADREVTSIQVGFTMKLD